jgi:ATP-binding cassette subfamily C (CFTR/MRP) protein 1
MQEFGSMPSETQGDQTTKVEDTLLDQKAPIDKKAKLILDEEREVGEVKLSVYTSYLKSVGNPLWIAIFLLLVALGQASFIANILFLGFWSGDSIRGFSQSEYMITYASESIEWQSVVC